MEIKKLLTEEQIEVRLQEIAEQIEKDYIGKNIVFLCVLKGSLFFTVELAKKIHSNVQFECIEVSSYNGTESTGKIKLNKDISGSIDGKDVIIIEDILDTGRTMKYLVYYIKNNYKVNSLKICTLLNKEARRVEDVKADYVGFEIEDKFVLGYGLDYYQDYRNLPYVGYVENDSIESKTII